MELSRESTRKTSSSSSEKYLRDDEKKSFFKLFSLCSNLTTDAVTSATTKSNSNTPSLAHFLEAERRRRATNTCRRNQYGPTTDYSSCVDYNVTFSESNSLFINGLVAPHQSPAASGRPGVANNNIIFRRWWEWFFYCFHVCVVNSLSDGMKQLQIMEHYTCIWVSVTNSDSNCFRRVHLLLLWLFGGWWSWFLTLNYVVWPV